MSILELRGVSLESKHHRQQRSHLVRDISFSLEAGEIIAIAGPNGAGKSSLLKLIGGNTPPDSGEIIFGGKNLSDWSLKPLAQQRAVLSQQNSLNFPYTVREVVALARSPHYSGTAADNQAIDEALAMMDLISLQNRAYTQLSGGEQQRCQLARVICQIWQDDASQVKLLLLDEPLSALDLGHQQQVLHCLKTLAQNKVSIVLVLHDLNSILKIANKTLLLNQGECVEFGPSETVLEQSLLSEVFCAEIRVVRDPTTKQIWITS